MSVPGGAERAVHAEVGAAAVQDGLREDEAEAGAGAGGAGAGVLGVRAQPVGTHGVADVPVAVLRDTRDPREHPARERQQHQELVDRAPLLHARAVRAAADLARQRQLRALPPLPPPLRPLQRRPPDLPDPLPDGPPLRPPLPRHGRRDGRRQLRLHPNPLEPRHGRPPPPHPLRAGHASLRGRQPYGHLLGESPRAPDPHALPLVRRQLLRQLLHHLRRPQREAETQRARAGQECK